MMEAHKRKAAEKRALERGASIKAGLPPTTTPKQDAGARITREEMVELFGEEMPAEAVNLLWSAPGETTCGELRDQLRALASTPKQYAASRTVVTEAWKALAIDAIDCVHEAECETTWGRSDGDSTYQKLRSRMTELERNDHAAD